MQVPKHGDKDPQDQFPLPNGYNIVYEDHNMMSGKAFKIPGVGESWNNTAPPVRLLARQDVFNHVRHRVPGYLHRAVIVPPPANVHSMQPVHPIMPYASPMPPPAVPYSIHPPVGIVGGQHQAGNWPAPIWHYH